MEKLNLEIIAGMSDDEVYNLSIVRPQEPIDINCRGFMFPLKTFKSKEEMAVCISVLIKRLSKINKNNFYGNKNKRSKSL